MATTMTSARIKFSITNPFRIRRLTCVNSPSKTNPPRVRVDNTGIKKRKGPQFATRSRDSLSSRRSTDEDKRDGGKVNDYMRLQPEITAESRANLIKWVIDIHSEYNLFPETLYLTVNIIDRFLGAEVVRESELHLIGLTAMFIASKYIEVHGSKDANEFVEDVLRNETYELRVILDTEKRILIRLDYRLSIPTMYTLLMGVIKDVEIPLETEIENMVYFYAELGMMNYEITSTFDPLMVAAATIYAACATLKKIEVYDMLAKQAGFKEMPVLDCARMLGLSHSFAKHDKRLETIYEKYADDTRDEVAVYTPAEVLLLPAFTLTRKVKKMKV